MGLLIVGADTADTGPRGCVARFLLAGDAGDTAAAMAEMHPDSRDGISGGVNAPPGIESATVGDAEADPDGVSVRVPTDLAGADGTAQRFVFVVRPSGDAWGIDLPASMTATFGMDPMQMMENAMRTIAEPMGEMMSGIGEAMGSAFDGMSGGGFDSGYGTTSDAPVARRIGTDETLPEGVVEVPTEVTARLDEIELRRAAQRISEDAFEFSTTLRVKVSLDLPTEWSALATKGVLIETARSTDGDDLVPEEMSSDFGAESYGSWERERRDCYFRVQLKSPAQPIRGIAALTGKVRLDLQGGELLEFAIGPIGSLIGQTVPIAIFGIEMAIARDENGFVQLRVPYGWFDRLAEFALTDRDGNRPGESWSGMGDGETSTREYQCDVPEDGYFVGRFWSRAGEADVGFSVSGLPISLEG